MTPHSVTSRITTTDHAAPLRATPILIMMTLRSADAPKLIMPTYRPVTFLNPSHHADMPCRFYPRPAMPTAQAKPPRTPSGRADQPTLPSSHHADPPSRVSPCHTDLSSHFSPRHVMPTILAPSLQANTGQVMPTSRNLPSQRRPTKGPKKKEEK